ncbi:MAG: CNNM domain-containing protein [Holosporales bacterium]|jgi:Mg2+/Co2+ transporter CorB|nr:CNNM domain-containing protein [Holosporales bacterium]
MILGALAVICLLACSAYFSACETAMTAYSRSKMYGLAADGNKRAAVIVGMQDDASLVISSILICSTVLNSLAVAFTTEIFDSVLGSRALVLAPIVTSILIVFIAEVLPKMLTVTAPDMVLLPSAYVIKGIYTALRPVNSVIGRVAEWAIRIVRRGADECDKHKDALEELKGAIALHTGTDAEDAKDERAMLQSVLELGTLQVSSVMTHRSNVTMFCADDDIEILIEKILRCPYTRIPLWSGDPENIVGVLHVTDLLKAMRGDVGNSEVNITELARAPWFIPENNDLLCQLQLFKRHHEHLAVVVDEYGSFMGIVTLEDVLEEIVGDIEDEHDVGGANGIRSQDDGTYIVDGAINVRDINREINTKFHSETAATIAGYMINEVGIIPEVGQAFILGDYKFEVLKRQKNQVSLIKLTHLIEGQEN